MLLGPCQKRVSTVFNLNKYFPLKKKKSKYIFDQFTLTWCMSLVSQFKMIDSTNLAPQETYDCIGPFLCYGFLLTKGTIWLLIGFVSGLALYDSLFMFLI